MHDTTSTNLCVQGLTRNVTEDMLGDYFARWGAIGAVKVRVGLTQLLPRGDTGFVAFMHREDAERAQQAADGLLWGASALGVSWARAIPLPSHPRFVQRHEPVRREREASPVPVRHRTERPDVPDAAAFQDEVRLPLTQGYTSLYSTDSEEVEESEPLRGRRDAPLSRLAQRRLLVMLRSLTPRRERIARCMALALDHAYAADTVAELIVQSLLIPSTPIPRKVARLYVLSDILHNSAAPVPHAWRYRDAFHPHLFRVFAHFGDVIRSFPGRMKADAVQRQFFHVLDCWDTWLVYPPALLEQLRSML